MRRGFVDTLHIVALVHPGDRWRAAALDADRNLGRSVVRITTHEVFCEAFASVARFPQLRHAAVTIYRRMATEPAVQIAPSSPDLFERGVRLYEARPDKAYSLVDCISMEVMREEGITEVLTYDHHFKQEGFTVLIR